jgi:hypothetical protein
MIAFELIGPNSIIGRSVPPFYAERPQIYTRQRLIMTTENVKLPFMKQIMALGHDTLQLTSPPNDMKYK